MNDHTIFVMIIIVEELHAIELFTEIDGSFVLEIDKWKHCTINSYAEIKYKDHNRESFVFHWIQIDEITDPWRKRTHLKDEFKFYNESLSITIHNQLEIFGLKNTYTF